MKNLIDKNNFAQGISESFDLNRMLKDLEEFSKLERYTGSEAGEKTVDIIVDRMKSLGIPVVREYYDIYRSLPGDAGVTVTSGELTGKVYPATPYAYSGSAKDLSGDVIFDSYSLPGEKCPQVLMESRFANFKGKIVLTYDSTYRFACFAKQAGALAILNIWKANLAHHGTLGGIWGTPEPDDLLYRYPYIPYVELIKSDGEELKSLLEKVNITVTLNVDMDNSIKRTSMPIATIKGKSDKFVLVSGHYDSWYEGITDNGVANVSMMEFARVLNEHKDSLKRTVVFAWWSGHSDGRYAGSTWYFDNHWHELKDKCVAHVNMDICGCMGSDLVGFNTSMIEGALFDEEFLKDYNDEKPIAPIPMPRFADQTFWGADVPLAIMPEFNRKCEDMKLPFYWWHSKLDSIDKIDPKIVMRDSKVISKLACLIANADCLPVQLFEYVDTMEKQLRTIEAGLNPDFNIADVFPYIERLRAVIKKLEASLPEHPDNDSIIKSIAGELTRITYTYSSPYHQDLAVEQPLFPKLSAAVGLSPENTKPDFYLATKTMFTRQKNRLTGQICEVIEKCEYQFAKWEIAKMRNPSK